MLSAALRRLPPAARSPPNLIEIGRRHVQVASRRDSHDVAPLEGGYSGGTASALDVTVDTTRPA